MKVGELKAGSHTEILNFSIRIYKKKILYQSINQSINQWLILHSKPGGKEVKKDT